ncbi:MAG: amidohydrolase family protein [Chitinophagaceae bacterium]|mgnify:CR=1 FL=1|nr:amidohydrolase family protein [Chitinophagaceae bacterium]HQV59226.1 amidohydrolase family protein [Chitinophagaceae bacterium]HQV84743.1 amidohydrolase family protein [Chitinophagaceae bacterium]HQX71752.1 amidohydrolase family protein [Chitinophagaceae bacterium]HQZ73766.1 amidohydrolase family protein [Chitinophagaceae bacterium]
MKKSSLLVFVLLITLNLFSQKTYIWCGTLVDGVSEEPKKNMTIVVEKNKIITVQNGFTTAGTSDKTIDLKTKTVTPGWIDMHVHMEFETNPNRYVEVFTSNPADYAFQSVKYAEVTLMAGFTTVRDLGGSGVNISLRNAINKGIIKGPRVYTAGKSIATTGGHADPTNGYRKELMGDPGPAEGVANGAEECRQAVRQRYKDGSDLIKITATGGVLSVAKSGKNPQFFEDEIDAIVKTAKDYGFKVAVHAHGEEGMKRAIRAGVNSIEHGTFMDDEAIELFKKHGTWYVPTITAGKAVGDSAKIPGYYPPVVVPKALETGPQIQKTFAKAYKAGVKIAFGTDAGVYKHGMNWLEFGYMIEAGMTPMDAIRSATISAADLLGEKDKLGSIEAGKLADIVAVDGDPLKDAKSFGKVVFVMKDGMVYKQQ